MAISSTRRAVTTLLNRTLTSKPYPPHSIFSLTILTHHLNPLRRPNPIPTRFKTTGSGYSPLNDPSPNWTNRPPKETILLDGCDFEHWLIVMEFPNEPKPNPDDMVNAYVNTLAQVVGSEEEAKMKIYSVSTTTYTGFGALISEELSYKVKELPGVLWVLPDSYLDVPNKDYGGDLFVDGKVIRRPQYDFTDRQPTRRNRPRVDRRRDRVQSVPRGSNPMQNQPQNWFQNQPQSMQQPMHNVQNEAPRPGSNPFSN